MELDECYKKRLIKRAKKDEELLKSLLETSRDKLRTTEMLRINNITASTIIVLVYDSLRETLEAIALTHGLKIYNHECFVPFLKNILNESRLAAEFNRFRKIRNSVNYYGQKVSVKEADVLKKNMVNFRKRLIDKFLR